MIKAFALGLIMGAVIGMIYGAMLMAVLQVGKDDKNE